MAWLLFSAAMRIAPLMLTTGALTSHHRVSGSRDDYSNRSEQVHKVEVLTNRAIHIVDVSGKTHTAPSATD
eukprot:COSAG02_NODE_1123_length_14441_cov_28.984521_19_plen_71_part_00